MKCDWKENDTRRILDGISCPKCKVHTVLPERSRDLYLGDSDR